MTRDELIAALEKAEGPSRELDAEIHALVKPTQPDEARHAYVLRYTESIDAALTLVPEGWFVAGISEITNKTRGSRWDAFLEARSPTRHVNAYDHIHPAIALCIAALKARP